MRQLLEAAIVILIVGAFFGFLIHDRPRCTEITASVFAPDECE